MTVNIRIGKITRIGELFSGKVCLICNQRVTDANPRLQTIVKSNGGGGGSSFTQGNTMTSLIIELCFYEYNCTVMINLLNSPEQGFD